MSRNISCDLCVIGAGSGGLSVAAAAAQFGARVTLIERGEMGGDCLNYGCVPSKALLAAAKQAHLMRQAAPFGIGPTEPTIDFKAVHDHVHQVIASIAPHDSQERFEGLGVRVIREAARFTGRDTVLAGSETVTARRFVIATGSRAAMPPIPGLETVPCLTNETIFNLTERPAHLIVIGAGPIGLEMAQAHRRLGSQVTVLEAFTPLAKDDPELAELVLDSLRDNGVDIRTGIKISEIGGTGTGITVTLDSNNGDMETITGSHLLVAAGRQPQIDGLDLDAAGIAHDRSGITVDKSLRSTNRRIYAIGDVAGGPQFTHAANYHAGLVVRNALFGLPVKVRYDALPWVTYTDPELAHVGLSEADARDRHDRISVLRSPFKDNDRAQCDRQTHGLVKVVVGRRGRILGASIVGAHAGELIQPWALAIASGLKIKAMIDTVLPYPTLGEVNKRAAFSYYSDMAKNRWVRRVMRLVSALR